MDYFSFCKSVVILRMYVHICMYILISDLNASITYICMYFRLLVQHGSTTPSVLSV